MTHRFSKAGLGAACAALFVGSAVLLVQPTSVAAAPQERSRAADIKMASSKLAQAEPTTTSSIKTVSDEQPACDRPRRRLWLEGEGWVVRRVSACH